MIKPYDLVIIGGGISGTALLYTLVNYSNIKNIALIEKYPKLAQVNSKLNNNSQTLHFGDIETNYTLEKAKSVKRAATMVRNYILKHDKEKETYSKTHKIVLAIGNKEVNELEKRYREFKTLFPKMKKLNKKEIAKLEPEVFKRRDEKENIMAILGEEGYAIDFGALSRSFVKNSLELKKKKIDIFLNEKVIRIEKNKIKYKVLMENKELNAKAVAVTAGAHSLLFAKSLGYGKDYSLLMISGNFYITSRKMVNGKIYTMQNKKLPFAAVHADPEVHDKNITRFGPTAKMLFMLERHNYKTIKEYFKSANLNLKAFKSFLKIVFDKTRFGYMFKNNLLFEIPILGKILFTKEARKIIPDIKARDLTKARGYGGVRPQIVNTKTGELMLGEAKIIGDRIIFNMTPSPGASTCLKNAEEDAKNIVGFLGKNYKFNSNKFEKDFSSNFLNG